MEKIRFRKLVALANRVRAAEAGGASAQEWQTLRNVAQGCASYVRQVLADAGYGLDHLPAPSRHAVLYLEGVDWDAVATVSGRDGKKAPSQMGQGLTLSGLNRWLESMLDRMAQRKAPVEPMQAEVQRISDRIEADIHRHDIEPHNLTRPQREVRGWAAFMAEPANFHAALEAIDRFNAALKRRWPPMVPPDGTILVHLRPTRMMYRLRPRRGHHLLTLPTAMLTFDAAAAGAVAVMVRGDRSAGRPAVVEAMMKPQYQAIESEIESFGGVVERVRGSTHDLAESFDRVNRRYFDGCMPRPALAWSQVVTGWRFGSYEYVRDRVTISITLDAPSVPAYVLDFVMYHELLHKHFGLRWRNGQNQSHTAAFREAERRFERYREADAVLERLAAAVRDRRRA